MKVHVLEQEQVLPISIEEAWAFFSTPRNLDEITPPDLGFFIEHCEDGPMFGGQIITYRIKIAPLIWVSWVTEIRAVEEGVSFVDNQMCGPYKLWHHRHSFEEVDGGVLMRDRVHYGLGFGPFGALAHALFVGRKVKGIFESRRKFLAERFGQGPTSGRSGG